MKKFLVIAVLVFSGFVYAKPRCADLPAAKAAVDAHKQNLKSAEGMLQTSLTPPSGVSIETFTDEIVRSYGKCESLDLHKLNGLDPAALVSAILKVLPDKDDAARCYDTVMLHMNYNWKIDAGELCHNNDTPVSSKHSEKLQKIFGGGNGGVMTTEANYFKCKKDMKEMAKAFDQLTTATAAYNQVKGDCKEEKEELRDQRREQDDNGAATAPGTP